MTGAVVSPGTVAAEPAEIFALLGRLTAPLLSVAASSDRPLGVAVGGRFRHDRR